MFAHLTDSSNSRAHGGFSALSSFHDLLPPLFSLGPVSLWRRWESWDAVVRPRATGPIAYGRRHDAKRCSVKEPRRDLRAPVYDKIMFAHSTLGDKYSVLRTPSLMDCRFMTTEILQFCRYRRVS